MKSILLLFLPLISLAQPFTQIEISRYKLQCSHTTIIRDDWGIPHIYGKTDANAVFGLLFAQCEDDFARVEMNALEMLGRTSEVNGESSLYKDLQMRMIYDSTAAINDYKNSPPWFKKLLDASADGVNYYIFKNPGKPKVLHRFQPWYALMRTDGSIDATSTGGIKISDIKAFYTGQPTAMLAPQPSFEDISGSNGFALAPSKTVSHNAMLYINPHVTFYFREEVQMVSDEGLNAYGAVTWGQFFVYQGFNEHCGWMHTSSHADVADVYREKIIGKNDGIYYSYDGSEKKIHSKNITIHYKQGNQLSQIHVTGYYTHHGPVLAGSAGEWFAVKEYNRSLKALMQSWLRTKANSYAEFEKVMDMRTNTTNNTVYADDKGNIAYWHGDFMPMRDSSLNWSLPVDGSTSATEWKGLHPLKEIVQVLNPATGWIQNCNSTPFTVSGNSSPNKKNYPAYMAPDGQNPRAVNAMKLLNNGDHFTLDKLIATGYNSYLSAFDILLPPLFTAYNANVYPLNDSIKEAIQLLRDWNKESAEHSVATTIAIEWASTMSSRIKGAATDEERSNAIGFLQSVASGVAPKEQLTILDDVLKELRIQFGTWKVEWGIVNRYQRKDYDLGESFNDLEPSLPEGNASSQWGCLPSFSSIRPAGGSYRYGVSGNSFVAAVEFGKTIKAKTIVTGGEGTVPTSKHFLDQADGYIHGKFKDVYFYKPDVLKHKEKMYHP